MKKTFTGNEGNRNSSGVLLYGLIVQTTLKQQAFTCQATATKTPSVPLTDRKSLEIFNNANTVVYYGASDVSTSNGSPVYPRMRVIIQIEDGIDVYTISASGGEDLRLVEGA